MEHVARKYVSSLELEVGEFFRSRGSVLRFGGNPFFPLFTLFLPSFSQGRDLFGFAVLRYLLR